MAGKVENLQLKFNLNYNNQKGVNLPKKLNIWNQNLMKQDWYRPISRLL